MSGGELAGVSTDAGLASRWGVGANAGLGLALVGGAATQFVGLFTRYATITLTSPGSPSTSRSYSLLSGLNWHGMWAFGATVLTLAIAGGLFAARPSRARAAFIVGFAALVIGGISSLILSMARAPHAFHRGPGFFINLAGMAVEACVAVVLFVLLWRSTDAYRRTARSTSPLAVGSAVLVGLSAVISPVVYYHRSLARFSPWSIGSTLLAVSAFVTAAALPLLASRLNDRDGALVTTGIALALTIAVVDAVSTRISGAVIGYRLTPGFLLDLATIGLLIVMGRRLRQSTEPIPPADDTVPVDA